MTREWTKAQQLAMRPLGTTVLVSAAAGSGKTATLTERIIRRLTDPEHPAELSRMLIITFTRAATAELKQRISESLAKAIAEDPSNAHLQRQYIGLGSAHISTIDAFFYEPVKARFAECGFPASFRIADDAELIPLYERIMEGLVDEYYAKYAGCDTNGADDHIFSMLQDNAFADLCDALSESKQDAPLIGTLLSLYNQLLSFPAGLSRLTAEAEGLRRGADEDFLLSSHGRVLAEYIGEICDSYLPFFDETCEHIANDPIAVKSESAPFCYDRDFSHELKDHLMRQCYASLRAHVRSYRPISLKGNPNLDPCYADYRQRRNNFKDHVKDIANRMVEDADTVARQMRATADMCDVLYDLLSTFDRRINEEKRSRGICTFDDNRRYLLHLLLDEKGHPTPMAQEYLSDYDEVYIDEYQDVDEMQDMIFSLIGGDHRFMVGDIKQSIYGFRGADPTVFSRYRRECRLLDPNDPDARPEADATGVGIFMSNNFRCDESVIRVSNAVCGHIFAACPDTIAYTNEDDLVFSKVPPSEDYKSAPVEVAILRKESAAAKAKRGVENDNAAVENEAIYVANRVADLFRSGARLADGRPIRPQDVAILLRNRQHFGTFMTAMAAMGIPTGCDDLEKTQAVKDVLHGTDMTFLVNLLRVIDNPDNDIPLSEVLRAPFPGLSPEDLLTLREQDARQHSLYASLEACADGMLGDAALRDKAIAFRDWLEHYRHLAITLPADALLRQLRRDARCACRTSKAFAALYDSARTYHPTSFTGLYAFLRFFEKKLATAKNGASDPGGNAERVSLMTIHNSKGLEFPVCFVVMCGQPFSAISAAKDLLFEKKTGLAMKLYDRRHHAKTNTILRRVTALAITRTEREEEMRLLYVAMTRARERLYLVGSASGTTIASFARGDRAEALAASSYLSWITAALEARPDVADFVRVSDHLAADVTPDPPLDPAIFATVDDPETMQLFSARYRAILDAFTPPTPLEEAVRCVPTKVPASRLTAHLLDDCIIYQSDRPVGDEDKLPFSEQGQSAVDPRTLESIRTSVKLMSSGASTEEFELLLRANARPTAAEKGTAAHIFLQYCDYRRVLQHGPEEEIARLHEEGFINDRVMAILDRKQMNAFFHSKFFAHVMQAVTVERELRFARFVPLKTLTKDADLAQALGERSLYVQGSIDLLCIYADGHIELCDYKTDRLTKEEKADAALLAAHMQEKHGSQLAQYADAIEETYHRRPTKVYVYSVPLGEAVEISV